ncbi:ATP-binding cassette domain-containing protein [Streptomyces akebiae]|uniref:ATP-binding cassette domain-containing protein n=1 Tax=Streptomyces akebiae TaxID=2865673 RepID=A0ABX8Y4R1_9ACTN|nr:ATP-binding cassette domain-containing protein [Streptomyces akebiae]
MSRAPLRSGQLTAVPLPARLGSGDIRTSTSRATSLGVVPADHRALVWVPDGHGCPISGRVLFSGTDLTSASREFRRHVAWLPQRVPSSRQLTAREYVAYIAWLKGESRSGAWERAAVTLDQVGLAEQADQKTAKLSGGQLRRVGIACALAHDARVILLDEPTAGLDPHQRTVFRDVLREVSAKTPVLMSTHDVADLADEADTVTLMDGGRIRHHGATQSFLDHAHADAVPARRAESAYSVLMRLENSQ